MYLLILHQNFPTSSATSPVDGAGAEAATRALSRATAPDLRCFDGLTMGYEALIAASTRANGSLLRSLPCKQGQVARGALEKTI